MIVPVGLISFIGLRLTLPADRPTGRVALDWTGFLSLSVAIACVQLVLSRGQRLDWFESGEILIETFVAILAFWIFIAHSLTAQRPFLNLGLLRDRNYALGPGAGDDLRHAELHAHGAAAAAAAAACRLSRHADRRDHRRARRRRHHRLLPRDLRRPHGSAHRPDRRLRPAGDLGPVADGARPQCRRRHADGQQPGPGHRHRRHLGAAHARHLRHHQLGQPRRGHRRLSPAAQHRLELLHLDLRRRGGARHRAPTTAAWSRW